MARGRTRQRTPSREHSQQNTRASDSLERINESLDHETTSDSAISQDTPASAEDTQVTDSPEQEPRTDLPEVEPSASSTAAAEPQPGTSGTTVSPPVGEPGSSAYQRQAQTILDKLQSKRQQDAQMIDDYKQKLEKRTESQVRALQEKIFEMHTKRNSSVQPVLQELQATLTRCRVLESDIAQFKERLSKFHALVTGQ